MKPVQLIEWDGFDARRFLDEHWQHTPLLIRGWLKPAALGIDQIVSATADSDLGSRLVVGSFENLDWLLEYGPFAEDDLPPLDRPYQSALVQDMDKKFPQVAELLEAFGFLPNWLIDDIMVSQAGPGGSVGPHVDAYDVFLVQAAGSRRWELAGNFQPDLNEDFELAVLRNFKAETSCVTEPGDVLYVPPGIAHHGIAQGNSQTWSVGLRAPSSAELLSELAAFLSEHEARLPRLNPLKYDTDRAERIDQTLLQHARRLLTQAVQLDDDALISWLGQTLTAYRQWSPETESDEPPDMDPEPPLAFPPGTRLAWSDSGLLFVNGQQWDCPPEFAQTLCRTGCVEIWPEDETARAVVEHLIEQGELAGKKENNK
ncbi:MAG: cupin domain-containing protein [Wenzhouxiangellaceae bacterium]|nr:cupin domain-containing protein [Wenzhouxiangellaceae bacterium]